MTRLAICLMFLTVAAPVARADDAAIAAVMQRAVSACWNLGALSEEARRMSVLVAVRLQPDGRPKPHSVRLIEAGAGSAAAEREAFAAARRAILRCGARGYELPATSHRRWQDLELLFNPGERPLS